MGWLGRIGLVVASRVRLRMLRRIQLRLRVRGRAVDEKEVVGGSRRRSHAVGGWQVMRSLHRRRTARRRHLDFPRSRLLAGEGDGRSRRNSQPHHIPSLAVAQQAAVRRSKAAAADTGSAVAEKAHHQDRRTHTCSTKPSFLLDSSLGPSRPYDSLHPPLRLLDVGLEWAR